MFFDSHCHLTAEALAPQFASVVERARAAQVTKFLNIGDDLAASQSALVQAQNASPHGVQIWSTAGIHPQKAQEWNDSTTGTLRALLAQPEVVAVGEIGLDFFYDDSHPQHPGATREIQEKVLCAQLQLAVELALPVVLHNRDADDRLPSIVRDFPSLRGVFHCFGSPLKVAEDVLQQGFYLGFTGLVTFKNAGAVREVAEACPLDRMLIETDAPYLAPVPHRGKTNEPCFVPLVAQQLAGLHKRSVEEIGDITTRNACTLFGIDGA
jgi:TatD DNase family protein